MKKALITGITGQDGSYLAEYLLEQGYEVHGIIRRIALEDPALRLWRLQHVLDQVILHTGDSLESFPRLFQIFQEVMPDECYHLAAQSFVSYSFEDEFSTMSVNVNGTHCILSALHRICPECRFYFAGSSEMFGKTKDAPQNEDTSFRPRSVYGISKVAGFELTRNYREAYNIFACSGILFNHESPRRGFEFVTRKITSSAAKIKLGLAEEICLGNIEAKRDWGYALDYVKAMVAMLRQETPDDFVVGTGKTHSVKEFLEVAFGELDLDYQKHLVIDPRLYRPTNNEILVADPSKAQAVLGWQPVIDFEELVCLMVRADFEHFQKQL